VPLQHPKILAVCLGAGLALGALGGAAFALLASRDVIFGIGIGLMVVGLVALFGALLGATEPPEGWRTRNTEDGRPAQTGRRSIAARAAQSHSAIQRVSSAGMVVWGAVVGGGLIAAATLAFELAGSAR
jgi:hypothetical protein